MKNKTVIIFLLLFFSINIIIAQSITDFVFVKGGKFKMGAKNENDENPVHVVKINDFYVLNHEVTNAEFAEFLNDKRKHYDNHLEWINLSYKWNNEKCRIYIKNNSYFVEKGYENYPVTMVNWYGAQSYCQWIGGRLPTEAEWEYLAKKSLENIEFNEKTMSNYAVFEENSQNIFAPICSKRRILGIYDLFGNMSEWCSDWYSPDYYSKKEKKNPYGPSKGVQKVVRGGSWATKFSSISTTNRRASSPKNYNITIGFRVVIITKQ